MNYCLLSEEEKKVNKRMRNVRRAIRTRLSRKKARWLEWARTPGVLAASLMMDREMCEKIAMGTGQQAAAAYRLAKIHAARCVDLFQFPDGGRSAAVQSLNSPESRRLTQELEATKCPRTIQRNRRSWVLPDIVPLTRWTSDRLPTSANERELDDSVESLLQQCRILDCCCQTKEMKDWHIGDMQRLGFLPKPIPDDMLTAVQEARAFWECLFDACIAYTAGVRVQALPQLGPGWACASKYKIVYILPGVRIPKSRCRDLYLLRIHRNRSKQLIVDAYSEKLTPLFRHPINQVLIQT